MTRSQERLLGVAAMVVLLVAGAMLLVRPQRDATARARGDERAARAESQRLQDEIKALEALRANEADLREEAGKALAEFPPTPALPSLVTALQDAADKAGVELASISPSTPKASSQHPELAEISTQLTVNGGYFEIQDFLVRLEELVKGSDPAGPAPRSLLVNSVTLSAGSGAGAGTSTSAATTGAAAGPPDQLSATIGMSAFQLTGSANAAAPGTGAAPAGAQVR